MNKQLQLHIIGGFLGSGKTTAIQQACRYLLQQEIRVAVVTNDQGIHLVDNDFFTALSIPAEQVVNGCFCCRFPDLENRILSLSAQYQPQVIFAESVGSCTDLIATVYKPFQQYHPDYTVTISVFADIRLLHLLLSNASVFDEEVRYIYFKQLEEASLIVLSKVDLLSGEELNEATQLINKKYADKILLYQDSFNESHMQTWLNMLQENTGVTEQPSLAIDYNTYGKGEALLGWLDQELEITSLTTGASQYAIELVQLMSQTIRQQNLPIGHLKFLLNQKTKISYTTIAENEWPVLADETNSNTASLLINARVQTDPELLHEIVQSAISFIQQKYNCIIQTLHQQAFQPGFPRPTYRMA